MSRARKNVGGASVPLFRIFDGEQATRDALPQESALFRRNDGSAAFEIGQFQKQNALKVACYCPSRVGLRVVASDPTPRPDVRMVELAPRARRARCSSFSRATTVLEAVGVAGTGVGAGIAGAL